MRRTTEAASLRETSRPGGGYGEGHGEIDPRAGVRGELGKSGMSSRDVMDESVEYRARLIADALRRQTWIVVAAALLGALLGYGASVARPGSYVASASALITALPGNPYAPGVSGQDGDRKSVV